LSGHFCPSGDAGCAVSGGPQAHAAGDTGPGEEQSGQPPKARAARAHRCRGLVGRWHIEEWLARSDELEAGVGDWETVVPNMWGRVTVRGEQPHEGGLQPRMGPHVSGNRLADRWPGKRKIFRKFFTLFL
jgi:hypothetical protein